MSKTLERKIDQLEAQKNKGIIVAVTDTTLSGSGYRLSDGRHLSDSEFEAWRQTLSPDTTLYIVTLWSEKLDVEVKQQNE
jgi:zona occludens toxin (predicted ATPase)